jgi:hypothetical protein
MPALGAGGRWFESGRPHLFLSDSYSVLRYFSNVKISKFFPEEPKIMMNLILYSTLILSRSAFSFIISIQLFFNNIILSSYSCFFGYIKINYQKSITTIKYLCFYCAYNIANKIGFNGVHIL